MFEGAGAGLGVAAAGAGAGAGVGAGVGAAAAGGAEFVVGFGVVAAGFAVEGFGFDGVLDGFGRGVWVDGLLVDAGLNVGRVLVAGSVDRGSLGRSGVRMSAAAGVPARRLLRVRGGC